ncbi:BLUF domain-containing protein [Rhodoferax lacus]|nr:BLUF domain-containing protein [Rhodoferax lacus]
MQLTQLIYVSVLVDRDESVLGSILESSVRRNLQNGITGMLLYADGNFIQALEGTEAAVLETYQRICSDTRHDYVTTVHADPLRARCFAQWSMGFRQLGSQEAADFPQYAPYFEYGFDASALQAAPGVALDMLRLFCGGEM